MFRLELLTDVLGEAAKADISQKITIFMIVWWFVKRTISEHFKKVEDGLAHVAKNVSDLKDALTEVEHNHSMRLGNLESSVSDLKSRLHSLEKGE